MLNGLKWASPLITGLSLILAGSFVFFIHSTLSPPKSLFEIMGNFSFFFFFLILAFFLYWQRQSILSPPFRAVVSSHIAARDLESAQRWIQTAQRLMPNNPEFALLEANVARREGDMQTVSAALRKASKLGAARSDLNREQWLALAQCGQMKQAEPEIAHPAPPADQPDCDQYQAD